MSAALRRAGLVGWPLDHSLSPLIHQFWMREAGLPERLYELLPTPADALADRLRGLAAEGFVGCNITVPHKEAAHDFLREHATLDANAARLRAVNTIVVDGRGRLQGRNSDGPGFLAGLDEQAPDWRRRCAGGAAVVLGAGGAARAILAALADSGCAPLLAVNRTRERAQRLLDDLRLPQARALGTHPAGLRAALRQARLLVNATSLGMAGAGDWRQGIGSAPAEFLQHVGADATVVDIVYAPLRTQLLQAARDRGLACVDGLGMLLHQAVPCFEAWFGARPRVGPALRAVLEEALRQREERPC